VPLDPFFTRIKWIAIGIAIELLILTALFRPKPHEPGSIHEKNLRFGIRLLCLFVCFALAHVVLTGFVESYFSFPLLNEAADALWWAAAGSLVGAGIMFQVVSKEIELQEIRDLFRPLNIVKNQIDKLNNYANLAFGNEGSPINQTAYVSIDDAKQEIYYFLDQVEGLPEAQISESAKREAVGHLHTLADQYGRDAARREPSKIQLALQRIPSILSRIAACAQAWEKLEPIVKSGLGLK
jgi:hypothetical protein